MTILALQVRLSSSALEVHFSNSLIIQQVITKEIITVTVVRKSDLN